MATPMFFRERAVQAQKDADGAILQNVRERHLVARDTWLEMAERAESTLKGRDAQTAARAAVAAN